MKNEYWFKIDKMTKNLLSLGIQRVHPSNVDMFYLNLMTWKVGVNGKDSKEYLKSEVKDGDIIGVITEWGKLSFTLNGID